MSQTDLSIIIINWNTREMLRDCLESVRAGEKPERTEIIVVDNGSSDGSADMVAQEFPEIILIRNRDNRGFSAANNQAMRIASGRYLLLLNSDTLVYDDVLARSVDYLDARPEVAAMGCRVLNADGTVQRTCGEYPSLPNLLLLASGLWRLPWPRFLGKYQMTHWQRDSERDVEVVSGCYLLVRGALLPTIGLFDEDFFFFGEETDWCLRFRKAGHRLRFAPVGEITHYGGGSTGKLNQKRDLMLWGAIVRLHRKNGGRLPAMAAWTILFGFNLLRVVYWGLRGGLASDGGTRERAGHYAAVLRQFRTAWPAGAESHR